MDRPHILHAVVGFLRAGYPDGLPEHDYVPLFALLRRQLSDEEVTAVAEELVNAGEVVSPAAVQAAIRDLTTVEPKAADIARVQSRLAAGGWPLAPASEFEQTAARYR